MTNAIFGLLMIFVKIGIYIYIYIYIHVCMPPKLFSNC